MQFLVERFVPLRSQFKIILVSTGKKLSSLKEQVFFSNLTYGIDHLIQKMVFMSYLVSSRKLKFHLLVAFVRLTKVLSFCNEPLSLQQFPTLISYNVIFKIKILENKRILKKQFFLLATAS